MHYTTLNQITIANSNNRQLKTFNIQDFKCFIVIVYKSLENEELHCYLRENTLSNNKKN